MDRIGASVDLVLFFFYKIAEVDSGTILNSLSVMITVATREVSSTHTPSHVHIHVSVVHVINTYKISL